ncbi:MAG TPA: amidohydrolase [Vineibacter sp.]|nr:amidohydrolase [Vineibacter sp.]
MAPQRSSVIRNGRVLDIRAHRAPPADILVNGDTIAEIGAPGLAAPPDAVVIDATDRLIHPGLINAHMHGHGNLGKGLGDRWTLELLLTAGPWISGNRTLEDKYLGTLIGALEMLMKGCTACYDLTAEFPQPTPEGLEACGRAYADAGMRAVVAPMVASLSFFEAVPGLLDVLPAALQKQVERFRLAPYEASLAAMRTALKGWRFDHDVVRPAVAPTIPHHCSDAFMVECLKLAKDHDVGLHSHIQESKMQVIVGLKTYGKTQTAHLHDLGLLGPRFVAAHGVWLDDDDISRLADHGASVAHNPGSNMRLGNGIPAVKAMLARKLNVGIGTDGANCSDNLNVYEAMRLASLASKVQGPDTERWLTTEEVLEAATAGSARALGFGDKLGRIAKGYKADLVFVDLTHVNWLPCNDPTNQLVHTEDGNGVHSVMVGGKMVVENRRPVNVDLAGLARKVEAARARLEGANADNKALYGQLERLVNTFCPGLTKTPYHIDRFAGGHHVHQHGPARA